MTYGRSEFNKMIQKINKMTCIIFVLVLGGGGGGGGKINRSGQLAPPMMKITRVESKSLPGGKLSRGQDNLLHRQVGSDTA